LSLTMFSKSSIIYFTLINSALVLSMLPYCQAKLKNVCENRPKN
jgi:hypothetical protein